MAAHRSTAIPLPPIQQLAHAPRQIGGRERLLQMRRVGGRREPVDEVAVRVGRNIEYGQVRPIGAAPAAASSA